MIILAYQMSEFLQNMMLASGVTLIVAWLMLRLRKRGQTAERIARPAEQLEQHRQTRGLRGDLEEVMVEVEQLTKRFGAQLDAKSLRLEKLIDQADARIAELERLEPQARTSAPGVPDEPDTVTVRATPVAPPPVTPAAEEDATAQAVYRLADAGNDPIEIARTLDEHVGKIELILALRDT